MRVGTGKSRGCIGSTEWVEAHAAELKEKAVLYVNSDVNARGTLDVEGSHALQHFVNEAARDVKDPETGASVQARALAVRRVAGYEAGHGFDAGAELPLGALGSGSDYTPFLQHLGVNSLNVAFHGEEDYGVYHSAYDSFDHFRRFVDPTFQYEVALAQVAGRIVLRAAQADILPALESDFAASIAGYDEELHKLLDGMRAKIRRTLQVAGRRGISTRHGSELPRSAPPRTGEVPYLNFADLDNAVERLRASAGAFDARYKRLAADEDAPNQGRFNAALAGLEQALTDPHGLPAASGTST